MLTPEQETQLTETERHELARLRETEARLKRRLDDLAARAAAIPDGPRTITDIAKRLNLSRSRVHQIQNIAFHKIRRNHDLKDLLTRTTD
jgi:DNA-directed RNA polymerase sigma subunit (sigma70/sigma32)